MFPLIDAGISLAGLVIPPLFDFIKKKFIKAENDTPERTIGNLATAAPEHLPGYTKALADYQDALTRYFNRDVIGTASRWVVNLRAAIRPLGVICAFGMLAWLVYLTIHGNGVGEHLTGIRLSCEAMISSWFGHRISISR